MNLNQKNYLQNRKGLVYSMYSVDRGLTMKKGLVTIKKAAKILGVSIQTLIRWDKNGKLQASRHPMNNYRIYRLVDLKKIVDKIGEK